MRLFDAPDLLAVGWLANRERERRHGGRTYFNHNLRLEATNVCEASCLFCSFARLRPGKPGAHTMTVEQVLDRLRAARARTAHRNPHRQRPAPGLPFGYYKDLLRGLKAIRPDVHLKCFTAVEIAFFADHYGMTDEQVLIELREAGLDSLPGGGAEIFAPRVRRKICHDKCDGDRYLVDSPHRARLGHAHQRHDALRPHRDDGGARRSPAAGARAAGRDRRAPGVHPAGVPPRQQPDAQAARRRRRATRCACTPWPGCCSTTSITSRRTGFRRASRWRRRRCGSAPTTSTGPCRKRRSTTWPGRRRRRRCRTDEIERLIRDAGREPIERDTLYNVVRVPQRGHGLTCV